MTIGLSWTLLALLAPVGRLGTIGEPLRRDKDSLWAKRDVKIHAHVQHVLGGRVKINLLHQSQKEPAAQSSVSRMLGVAQLVRAVPGAMVAALATKLKHPSDECYLWAC